MSLEPGDRAAVKSRWFEVVYNEDGTLNEDAVLAELSDYGLVLREVPLVYSAITCGELSKTNYYAASVIAVAEECQTRAIKYEMLAALADLEAGVTTIAELREEYKLNDH